MGRNSNDVGTFPVKIIFVTKERAGLLKEIFSNILLFRVDFKLVFNKICTKPSLFDDDSSQFMKLPS